MDATLLHQRAQQLTQLSDDWPDLHERAKNVLARTTSSEFRIAVVGDFKRGKSTLLNALLGRDVLPTGILPVTAVPIEIVPGDDGVAVTFQDNYERHSPLSDIKLFTTEAENPGNHLGVAKVIVSLANDLLRDGLMLIDAPGMGSVHEDATETALSTYEKVDGAVLVLSMDSPLSAMERRIALEMEARGARLFIVVNKSDRFDAEQLLEVRRFVASQLVRSESEIYCLSAQAALDGNDDRFGDFATFRSELQRFVDEDLVRTRNDLLSREISHVSAAVRERGNLELLAGELDVDELDEKVRSLQQAIARERDRHDSDRRSIASEVNSLAKHVRARLVDDSEQAHASRIDEFLLSLPFGTSLQEARRAISHQAELVVREEFAQIWTSEAAWLDEQWQRLIERHRNETEARLHAVRSVATDLFSVEFSLGEPPSIERRPDENLYYFPPPMNLTEGFLDPLRRMIPASAQRKRLQRSASETLHRELAKHAGRSGAFLQKRLDESWRAFDRSMRRYLEDAVAGIVGALDRASRRRSETEATVKTRNLRLAQVIAESSELAET